MIYLISRHPRFSPNSEARDEALFRQLVLNFALKGQPIVTLDEATLERQPRSFSDASLILSMARSTTVLKTLVQEENRGVIVVNRPSALLETRRSDFQRWYAETNHAVRHWMQHELCDSNNLPLPEQCAILPFPLWWKRNATATQQADDVQYISDVEQLHNILLQHPGEDALLMEHASGLLLKAYGVEGTTFFSVAPHSAESFSKFGHEVHNSSATKAPQMDVLEKLMPQIQAAAHHIAQRSGFTCYGCDIILNEHGHFVFIDFNDFPSFSACLSMAANAIVERSLQLSKC